MASGDFDNDGAIDVAFVSLNDPPVVLHNETASKPWIGVRLRGVTSNRDAIGARLSWKSAGRTLTRWITGGGSFLASHDRRIIFAIGPDTTGTLEIRWPSGTQDKIAGADCNRSYILTEGTGTLKPEEARK